MRKVILLSVIVVLALPGTSLAQSAGDDQYADPFEKQQSEPAEPQRVVGSPAPEPVQATPVAGTAQSTDTAAGTETGQLARTGFDLPMLFVSGAVLLLAGVTIRRALTLSRLASR